MTTTPGMLFTLEGIDGSGKTTQRARVASRLRNRFPSLEIVETWEPGSTEFGQKVRDLVLDTGKKYKDGDLTPLTLALLILADRAEHVDKVILPALSRGSVVISDRFSDSTYAYQGYGAGIPRQMLKAVMREITCTNRETMEDGLKKFPIHTFYLDIPLDVAQARITKKERWDDATGDFKNRVLEGYTHIRSADPTRFSIVDADNPIGMVTGSILSGMTDMISSHYRISWR